MKILCIGRNYVAHVNELKNERPHAPVLFLKPETALLRPEKPFFLPDFSKEVHHEVELVVKIAKAGKHIAKEFAQRYYNKVSVGIDFTARDLQNKLKDKGLPWEKAKAFDGSACVGKWMDISDFNNIQNVNFSLKKNNIIAQKGNSKHMLFTIDEIISELSQFFTLKMGDLIFTGTPAGVDNVEKGDFLEGFLEKHSLFQLTVK